MSCKTLPMSFRQAHNRLSIAMAWLVLALPGLGQEGVRRQLTSEQGKAIVKAAWVRERQGGRKPDCSHLVHEVYERAGFPYSYANSFELYAGTSSFVPVTKPQAGDLVVWRGHVGIVVDPRQHSFYSSVRSGVRTDSYDSRPWKARGKARFYRYLVAPAVNSAGNCFAGKQDGKCSHPGTGFTCRAMSRCALFRRASMRIHRELCDRLSLFARSSRLFASSMLCWKKIDRWGDISQMGAVPGNC